VSLNACAIEWVFRVSQNDGIHDLVAGNLAGEKCALSFAKNRRGVVAGRRRGVAGVDRPDDHDDWQA
jgi:hypothetical protein